jgi:hypothetical protein
LISRAILVAVFGSSIIRMPERSKKRPSVEELWKAPEDIETSDPISLAYFGPAAPS